MNKTATKLEPTVKQSVDKRKNANIYKAIWRWHFYAGVFFAPLLIFLTITGGIYLFKPQIEDFIYHDLYYVDEQEQTVSVNKQINEVKEQYPNASINSFTPSYQGDKSSVIGITKNGKSMSVYVNPYDASIKGSINENERFMAFVLDLHNGKLWGGTLGNRLVELAACWAIILVLSGVYLWWPRNRKSLFGTVLPRIISFRGKRMFWRDMHAVTAFWLSIFIIIQLLSGLMWSDVWGSMANRAIASTGEGSPVGDSPWESYAFPSSTIPTKEVADVPWAAENMRVPESNNNHTATIPIQEVIQTAENNQINPGYQIVFPQTEQGVYTIFLDPAKVFPNRPNPWTQQTLHLDQYSGEILASYGWEDYGILGKMVSLGISFHQGEFGFFSQICMLALVIGILLIAISGMVMWWKRKPEGKLGAPSLPKDFKLLKGLTVIVIALGIFFPLTGISLLLIWIIDYLIIRRISRAKQWLG
ncbi:PepSY-associated TM helix domain-containing protein [Gracilibacillus salinarum]|uniref:PepSY domain-containing protein n=1 Tax=Gracilibacillus salinarum TaxID=2932255 RepID=A0ABY4GJX5_9BACI|nr:PepSY domain-containing protein [Gracilibacillus salinarum]UOQ84077.1 PepSY domain-containing protein [Gracilibacillus salinarum]